MEIRLLGPVRVRAGVEEIDAGPPQQRAVLAALAVDAGRPVRVATLVDRVWDEEPPAGARAALYSYMSRLRQLMRARRPGARGHDDPVAGEASVRLVGRGSGYQLDVDPQVVDLHRFRQLVAAARNLGSDDAERTKLLGEALRLWSGPPMAELPGRWAAQMRIGWQQERLDVAVQWAHAERRLGRSGELIGPVRRLLDDHPLSEPLVEVLMRALVAAGRDAEALEYYAAIRARLCDELGVEPSRQLRAVHQALLRGELDRPPMPEVPASTTPQAVSASTSESAAVVSAHPGMGLAGAGGPPRQLPREASWFTGRTVELEQLLELVPDPQKATAVVIAAIDGMAGIGKTALAVRAGHRLAKRYPDGHLFIELHGFAEGSPPVQPADALDRLLRALGVPGDRIPVDGNDRAALWRTVLAGRRMLILLDDAASEEQVRPLLPGTPGCLVLVTSRHRLVGLDATRTVSLDILPLPEAVNLLACSAGRQRPADEPVVGEAVELCGRLPLALRLAAGRLRQHPSWGMADLVDRLRDQAERLAALGGGARGVAAALEMSYRQLTAAEQRMYRLLGAHPGYDIEPHAAAALADTTPADAARLLDQLLAAHLLQETAPGRYLFHDLVRVHAARIAASSWPERHAALSRLLAHYRDTAAAAMMAGYQQPPQHPTTASRSTVDVSHPDRAVAWLDAELPNLLASAAQDDWPGHTMQLSATLDWHLRVRNHHRGAQVLHQLALTFARTASDTDHQLTALIGLGWVRHHQSRSNLAIYNYREALEIARTAGHGAGELLALIGLGDAYRLAGQHEAAIDLYTRAVAHPHARNHPTAETDVLNGLGNAYQLQGWYERAIDHFGQALPIARTMGYRIGELTALTGLANIHVIQGRYRQAVERYRQALDIARMRGHRTGELNVLSGLGRIHRREGRHDLAIDHFEQVRKIARATGHRIGELTALIGLANAYRLRGDNPAAADHCQRALGLAEEIGDRNWQFEARHVRGRLHHATRQPEQALTGHRQALELATALRQSADQARAHDGLAHAYSALGQPALARQHWECALELLTKLGTHHTDEAEVSVPIIRSQLAALTARRGGG